MQVAIVHDYLVQGIRGAERVVLEMHECYPEAPIHTLLFDPVRMGEPWGDLDVRTSSLQKMPGALKLYEKLYLLMPAAVQNMTFGDAEVILSSSSAWAKNLCPGGAMHVCYCYTPARFLWHWTKEYVAGLKAAAPLKGIVRSSLPWLRKWDKRGSERVNAFIAISQAVQDRIRRYYGRESLLIYPPVDTERFQPVAEPAEDYYLVVTTLNPYKRVDLAVKACTRLRKPLKVVGDGPELERLRAMAGPTVEFLGKVADEELPGLYARCRAFLMPQEEDFGIAPLEAQASGRPVIAYGAGGALETIVDGRTGLFFAEQTEDSLAEALRWMDGAEFAPADCRENSLRFSRESFRAQLIETVAELHDRWTRGERGVLV